VHLYEGWRFDQVTRCVRAFGQIGVKSVVLTNAAGGIRPEWAPGTLMRITDHVNLQNGSPLVSTEAGFANVYDSMLVAAIDAAAKKAKLELARGVYAGLFGPTYETPAEIRMLAWLGADAVGMSTVAEALAAHASGVRVAGISCITNHAAGVTDQIPNHEEVMEVGKKAAQRFSTLLEAATPELAKS
jgi:purine-nucleoside phosphorylase